MNEKARRSCVVVLIIICCDCYFKFRVDGFSPVTVTTRTLIPNHSPDEVQKFLASPQNWPKIVSTSMGVSSKEDLSQPLKVGKKVDEVFGLPPILPLYVTWTCTKSNLPTASKTGMRNNLSRSPGKSSAGRLEFFSSHGLPGVAAKCEMLFDIKAHDQQRSREPNSSHVTEVVLNMKYEPVSFLAVLAIPVLKLDNTVALKFLLPTAMRNQPDLDKFRSLMGTLYLGAGFAHLADCLLGGSQLLVVAGAPAFEMLSLAGRVYALLWCIMGPISFGLSRLGAGFADIGLLLYGVVEIGGAGLISYVGQPVGMNTLLNAVLVQLVVAGAWLYSARTAAGEVRLNSRTES